MKDYFWLWKQLQHVPFVMWLQIGIGIFSGFFLAAIVVTVFICAVMFWLYA